MGEKNIKYGVYFDDTLIKKFDTFYDIPMYLFKNLGYYGTQIFLTNKVLQIKNIYEEGEK